MQFGDKKIDIDPETKIADLRQKHLPINARVRMFCVGKEIKAQEWGKDRTIKDYNIYTGMTIQVMIN